jgi:hypothetical protein
MARTRNQLAAGLRVPEAHEGIVGRRCQQVSIRTEGNAVDQGRPTIQIEQGRPGSGIPDQHMSSRATAGEAPPVGAEREPLDGVRRVRDSQVESSRDGVPHGRPIMRGDPRLTPVRSAS